MKTSPRFILTLAAVLLGLGGPASKVSAQGCMPCKFMALSFGPDGVAELQPGLWHVGMSFRYLYADEGWSGTDRNPAYERTTGNQVTVRSFDFQLTHALTRRLSATLSLPYVDGQASNATDHDLITRRVTRARGVGDLRLVANVWLFDSSLNRNGNLSLGVGLKVPTGKEAATARFYRPSGPEVRPVDISIQPGDGGWGVMLETSGYRRLAGRIYGYANGYYLINPRETNSAYTVRPSQGQIRPLSVPDQYQARAGVSAPLWPAWGLAFSVGARINGMPAHDLVGGNEGFRRPGYVIYFDPGLSWTHGRNSFSLLVPARLDANRTRNVYDKRANGVGGGAFARRLWVVSYAFTL
jgi:hypothetical protein